VVAEARPPGGRLRSLVGTETRGLADQALASGVNFLTLILVARSVSPASFGFFALVFTLLQSLSALQLALVTRPHNVIGAGLQGAEYVRFTTTTSAYQLAFSTTAAILLAGGAAIARSAGAGSTTIFFIAAPTLVAWQLQELGRRVLYTERRLGAALTNDVLSYGAQAVLLIVLQHAGRLNATSALVVIGATSAVAAVVVAWQLRRSLGRSVDRRSFRETWRFGKWLGAAEVAYWFESQYYVYLAAALIGPAASGAVKAGQTLLGPVSVFLAFFVNYLPIRFARRLIGGAPDELGRQLKLGFRMTVPPVAAYAVLAGIFAPWLLEAVYGKAYVGYASVVRLFAVYYVLLSVSDVVVASLSARQRTRRVFLGHIVGALVSVACGWALLEVFGAAGGVAGMILAIAVAFCVFLTDSTPVSHACRGAEA
jgi:O-antigen/teichoic acid export membrane protein